jgi:hypothetical protein
VRKARTIWILALALAWLGAGCQGSVVTGRDMGAPDHRVTWTDGGPVVYDLPWNKDKAVYPDTQTDLTSKAGDPCTFGKCASNLICMANVCHAICTGECGSVAKECKPTEGCHWVTSFAAACMPGTAKYLEKCGNGVWCVGGYLCVKVGSSGAKCLKLCKNSSCPAGSYCGKTSNDCMVCIQ